MRQEASQLRMAGGEGREHEVQYSEKVYRTGQKPRCMVAGNQKETHCCTEILHMIIVWVSIIHFRNVLFRTCTKIRLIIGDRLDIIKGVVRGGWGLQLWEFSKLIQSHLWGTCWVSANYIGNVS